MKKYTYLFIINFLIAFSAFAQLDIAIRKTDGTDVTNSTISASGSKDSEISVHFSVLNKENSALSLKVKRIDNNVATGIYSYFCWGVTCYTPDDDTSATAVSINPDEENTSFIGYYTPNGNVGNGSVTYVFFDADSKTSDTAYVTVEYSSLASSIQEIKNKINQEISEALPNPANDYTKIKYSLKNAENAKIKVFNMTGKQIKETTLENAQGTLTIPVSDLPTGFYFYSLLIDDKIVSTKKFVVNNN